MRNFPGHSDVISLVILMSYVGEKPVESLILSEHAIRTAGLKRGRFNYSFRSVSGFEEISCIYLPSAMLRETLELIRLDQCSAESTFDLDLVISCDVSSDEMVVELSNDFLTLVAEVSGKIWIDASLGKTDERLPDGVVASTAPPKPRVLNDLGTRQIEFEKAMTEVLELGGSSAIEVELLPGRGMASVVLTTQMIRIVTNQYRSLRMIVRSL